ncbi:MAG: pantoate--beta-alanine ligase [Gammaproteobacteria bacterium]|nr:pantoate--beta-alanine ligase [Gammaproteobacteria bacterium]NNC98501.1 pantoate--beta-alanine ligase [Gammaproteobacteria bacterium]NNM13482.1 pantoate--beta-alanine ligase [Gammaproteobacteria bacterium]
MKTVNTIKAVREQVRKWKSQGLRVAFVPTMGNLHAGHMTLLAKANEIADKVVASIFVNPLQFGPFEDYDQYPRTPDADVKKLTANGCELLFLPSVEEMYPLGKELATTIDVPGISDILCGKDRPGHFVGMATVVSKLLNAVQPDVAIFGQKDYQQLMIIRRMVLDLCMPVEIVGAPTNRESGGLAMSSRNQYLSKEELKIAPLLYATLTAVGDKLKLGERDFSALEKAARKTLTDTGFKPSYFEIRKALDLQKPNPDTKSFVVITAAHLGKARLIDNLVVTV